MPHINFADVGRLIENFAPLGFAVHHVIHIGHVHSQTPVYPKVHHHASQFGARQLLHIACRKAWQLEFGIHRRIEDQLVWIGLTQIQVITPSVCKSLCRAHRLKAWPQT